jgi:hypothetical protein
MNLYTYEVLYLDRHQDLLAAAAETQLAKLAQENLAKTNQKSPKFIDDFFPESWSEDCRYLLRALPER